MILYKECHTCKTTKESFEFRKMAKTKDGLSYNCKDCSKQKTKNYIRPPRKRIRNQRQMKEKRVSARLHEHMNRESWLGKSCVGCSPQDLKDHIAKQFCLGMNWGNYKSLWAIDHIVPVSSFSDTDLLKANYFTNLQPLLNKDNLAKGAATKLKSCLGCNLTYGFDQISQSSGLCVNCNIMNSVSKECSVCHKEKSVTDYYPNYSTKDKLSPWCKDCHKNNSKEIYELDKPEKIKKSKKRQKDNPAASKDASKKYRSNPLNKFRAKYQRNSGTSLSETDAIDFCFKNGVMPDGYGSYWKLGNDCTVFIIGNSPDIKTCVKCKENLPHSSFGAFNRNADGLNSWCKQCKRDHAREKYLADPVAHRARVLQWETKKVQIISPPS